MNISLCGSCRLRFSGVRCEDGEARTESGERERNDKQSAQENSSSLLQPRYVFSGADWCLSLAPFALWNHLLF